MEKVKNYIEDLFENAPKTKSILDLKQALISDMQEKYSDLIKEGKTDKDAYQEVITSIGNVDELINSHKGDIVTDLEDRKKGALTVSICAGLYILALISAIVMDEYVEGDLGGIVFLTICGISTCILIYHYMSTPRYKKKNETMVEEFKEWKSNKDKTKEIRNSISAIIWVLIVIIYFLISFIFGIWFISWIIFIVGGLLELILDLIIKLGE